MKIVSVEFEVSAPELRACPAWALPEFAFIGRSNVGKSSLINLLAGRRDLAKVSDLPGKTKLINFFVVNGAWSLVDLPGYGYAEVGRQRRMEFNTAVADYLAGRRNLRGVYVLIDSRLPPQAIDLDFLQWLEGTGVPWGLIFTKTDKQSEAKTASAVAQFLAALPAGRPVAPEVLRSSAETKRGRGEILASIGRRLAEAGRATG